LIESGLSFPEQNLRGDEHDITQQKSSLPKMGGKYFGDGTLVSTMY
jgi:hypothetical protein